MICNQRKRERERERERERDTITYIHTYTLVKERHKNTHIHTKTLNPDLNPAKKNDDDDTPEKKVFFLDAPAGTGKTFVLNQLLAYVRSRGKKFVSTGNRIRVSTAQRFSLL